MPGFQEPAPSVVKSVGAADTGSFGAEDLDGEDVGTCRKFPMPKGKHLWIFPLSGADQRTLMRWCSTIQTGVTKDDSDEERATKIEAAAAEARVYQVILCCYRDEQRRVRCFERKDFDRVSDLLRDQRIKAICAVSDELGGEGVDLGSGDLQAFFSRGRACLKEWLSASDGWANCPSRLKEQTRALITQWKPAA
jgi:hypothetical protein